MRARTRERSTGPAPAVPDVYTDAALYDRLLGGLDFDLAFWTRVVREGNGPALDLGCGTGRVLLHLLQAGLDVDGVDLNAPMLDRLREKAAAMGLAPALVEADMRAFAAPRRYARVISAFNAFAHADSTEAQLATLECARAHLVPGGAFVVHMSYPGRAYWAAPDGEPVLELETTDGATGHTLQMWDTRHKDPVGQRQSSTTEARVIGKGGRTISSHRFSTTQRWVYRFELELLFRAAGYARWRVDGGFEDEPLERDDQQMLGWAWTA